jgi:hypothetical protein
LLLEEASHGEIAKFAGVGPVSIRVRQRAALLEGLSAVLGRQVSPETPWRLPAERGRLRFVVRV